jgi:hypothetical protein
LPQPSSTAPTEERRVKIVAHHMNPLGPRQHLPALSAIDPEAGLGRKAV